MASTQEQLPRLSDWWSKQERFLDIILSERGLIVSIVSLVVSIAGLLINLKIRPNKILLAASICFVVVFVISTSLSAHRVIRERRGRRRQHLPLRALDEPFDTIRHVIPCRPGCVSGTQLFGDHLQRYARLLIGADPLKSGVLMGQEMYLDHFLMPSLETCTKCFLTCSLTPEELLRGIYAGDFKKYFLDQVNRRDKVGVDEFHLERLFLFRDKKKYKHASGARTHGEEEKQESLRWLQGIHSEAFGTMNDLPKKDGDVIFWEEMVRLHKLAGFKIGYAITDDPNNRRDMGYFISADGHWIIDAGDSIEGGKDSPAYVICVLGEKTKNLYGTRLRRLAGSANRVDLGGSVELGEPEQLTEKTGMMEFQKLWSLKYS